MKKETDLDGVKSVAINLVMIDYHKTEMSPAIVQHPFTNTGIVQIKRNGTAKVIDITKSDENFKLWQRDMVVWLIFFVKTCYTINKETEGW